MGFSDGRKTNFFYMERMKQMIEEWEKLLNRHRLGLITSSMTAFYEELEMLIPIKAFFQKKEKNNYYTVVFTKKDSPNDLYELVNEKNERIWLKKQSTEIFYFVKGIADMGLYYSRVQQPSIMNILYPLVEDLLRFTTNEALKKKI